MSVDKSTSLLILWTAFQVILKHDGNVFFRIFLESFDSSLDGFALDLLLFPNGIVAKRSSKSVLCQGPFRFWDISIKIFCLELRRVRWSLGDVTL